MATVAVLIPNYFSEPNSGIVVFYRFLIEELLNLGLKVNIFADAPARSMENSIHFHHSKSLNDLKENAFDFAIAPNAGLVGDILAESRIARIQILTIHTDHLVDRGRSRIKGRYMAPKYIRLYQSHNFEYFLSNSKIITDHISKAINLSKRPGLKIVTAPHPVVKSSFAVNDYQNLAKEMETKFLLVIGTRSARKRAFLIAKLWINGSRKGLNPDRRRLVFVGPKGHQDKWISLYKWLMKDDLVQILGPISESKKKFLITCSDAVIVPSRFESYSLVINETLSLSRPVICFADVQWSKQHILRDFINYADPNIDSLFRLVNSSVSQDWAIVQASLRLVNIEFESAVSAIFVKGRVV